MHARSKMIWSISLNMALIFAAAPAKAEQYDLSSPMCASGYLHKAGKCEVDPAVAKYTLDQCNAVHGTMNPECKLAGPPPTPYCRAVAGGTNTLKDGRCIFDTKIETSASGDYVGDHFKIVATPDGGDPFRLGGTKDQDLKVLSQKPLGKDDRMLTVYNESDKLHIAREVKASDLIEFGARRTGYTYGALAIPYKYYAGDKSFGPGVAIGPYVGWRLGTPGSAYTFAGAATIGNVKGETRDAQDKITSTPDLMAYSVAVGVMWDISKAQGVKPFKLGVFAGVDSVSSDNVVKFKNNRKPWLALQIGFDFTDN